MLLVLLGTEAVPVIDKAPLNLMTSMPTEVATSCGSGCTPEVWDTIAQHKTKADREHSCGERITHRAEKSFSHDYAKACAAVAKNHPEACSPCAPGWTPTYCHTPGGYWENGRTNFANDVCNSCTLDQCKARCDGISACVGFDTSVSGTGSGTCWMKSSISVASADYRSANGGTRTTYFNEDRNSDYTTGCTAP